MRRGQRQVTADPSIFLLGCAVARHCQSGPQTLCLSASLSLSLSLSLFPTSHRDRDKSWDTGQPPADIDAAQDAGTNTYTHTPGDGRPTHSTHTHVTYTYMQGDRNAEGGHIHPLTPAPHRTQIIPPSPIPHTRAAARAALAVSEPP